MATVGQATAGPTNRLDWYFLPPELKLLVLDHISSYHDLCNLSKAYPEWMSELAKKYGKKRFTTLWDSVLRDIDPLLIVEVIIAYQMRKVRKDYATSVGSSRETPQDRDRLEHGLRGILSLHRKKVLPEVEENLETIIDMGNVVRDVNSLTHRYSNESWKRVRGVAEATGSGSFCATGNPTTIKLNLWERFKFQRAFLRVEIYLLTKFWTNAQGERHILNMGEHVLPYIPQSNGPKWRDRDQFDSCLRYMFNAYRSYLKKTARELGAPELPPRDDLPWVCNRNDNFPYEFEDYPTPTKGDPRLDFEHRSVSEEQCLLLWLCERGIGPLEETHQAGDGERRGELLRQFGRRHVWETVKLRHRFSRYDWRVDLALSHLAVVPSHTCRHDRNRHPVMSLYGQDEHQKYSDNPSPWACATSFLTWLPHEGIREIRKAVISTRNEIIKIRNDIRLATGDMGLLMEVQTWKRSQIAIDEIRDAILSTGDDIPSIMYDIRSIRDDSALNKIREDMDLIRRGAHSVRDDIVLNEHGAIVTMSDTDMGRSCFMVFRRRPGVSGLPFGHPYMFEAEKYELRPQTQYESWGSVP